ncbi:hypothetical protein HK101_007035, partial [Irineochytrium annulatum]
PGIAPAGAGSRNDESDPASSKARASLSLRPPASTPTAVPSPRAASRHHQAHAPTHASYSFHREGSLLLGPDAGLGPVDPFRRHLDDDKASLLENDTITEDEDEDLFGPPQTQPQTPPELMLGGGAGPGAGAGGAGRNAAQLAFLATGSPTAGEHPMRASPQTELDLGVEYIGAIMQKTRAASVDRASA